MLSKLYPIRSHTGAAQGGISAALGNVEEEALPALASEFNAILGFIEQLGEVDVEGVEPMVSVTPMRLKRRQDVVTDGNIQAEVLRNNFV